MADSVNDPPRTPAHNGLLGQLRKAHEASAQKRSARLDENRQFVRPSVRFEDYPEFKQIAAQKTIGAFVGVSNPFYRPHQAAAGATTVIDGEPLVNFASYDYLGTNANASVAEAAKHAIDRYGISASASRLVAGERPIHAELEQKLATLYQVEAAVCFVSGYLANVATISCLMGPQDLVIHDEFIHNSALAGIRQSQATRRFFKHNDVADLETILRTISGEYRRILVIVEGVYSMDGDIADLPALVELRSRYGFILMVDEAHALGVLGQTGLGIAEHFHLSTTDIDIWMGTLSKSTSSCGGYIAGSHALVEILKAEAGGFVYSVGLAPVLAAAAIESLNILQREPERVSALHRNGTHFLELARAAGLDTGLSVGYSVIPVLVGDSLRAVQLSNELKASGVNVLPIIHPAVSEGMARLRFFITQGHTDAQIRSAVELTAEKLKSLADRNFGLGSLDMNQLRTLMSKE